MMQGKMEKQYNSYKKQVGQLRQQEQQQQGKEVPRRNSGARLRAAGAATRGGVRLVPLARGLHAERGGRR